MGRPEPLSREWVLAAPDRAGRCARSRARIDSLMPAWLEQSAAWHAGHDAARWAEYARYDGGCLPAVVGVAHGLFGAWDYGCYRSPTAGRRGPGMISWGVNGGR